MNQHFKWLAALTVFLSTLSAWHVSSAIQHFNGAKGKVETSLAACLANIEQQQQSSEAAQRGGVWPCWHQQINANHYQTPEALAAALRPAHTVQGLLYSSTLGLWLLVLVLRLKQRQTHTD